MFFSNPDQSFDWPFAAKIFPSTNAGKDGGTKNCGRQKLPVVLLPVLVETLPTFQPNNVLKLPLASEFMAIDKLKEILSSSPDGPSRRKANTIEWSRSRPEIVVAP